MPKNRRLNGTSGPGYIGLMLRRRAMRSSIGGWVLKRFIKERPVRGFTMNMWAVEGFAFMGIAWEARESFSRAPASP
jgi:hypothetical protein